MFQTNMAVNQEHWADDVTKEYCNMVKSVFMNSNSGDKKNYDKRQNSRYKWSTQHFDVKGFALILEAEYNYLCLITLKSLNLYVSVIYESIPTKNVRWVVKYVFLVCTIFPYLHTYEIQRHKM